MGKILVATNKKGIVPPQKGDCIGRLLEHKKRGHLPQYDSFIGMMSDIEEPLEMLLEMIFSYAWPFFEFESI